MLTLALDTSTSQGGVAVLKGDAVLSTKTWLRDKSHSELLTPTIEECLRQASVNLKDLEVIGVGIGPGSFTGIRVAVNVARSIGFALGTRLAAFNTMEILAAAMKRTDLPVLAIVNAHKNLLYTSRFEFREGAWLAQMTPAALPIEEIAQLVQSPHLCVGDAYEVFADVIPAGLKSLLQREPELGDYPQPETLGMLAQISMKKGLTLEWKDVQALYIRASEAEEKLRDGRLKRPPTIE